MEIAKYTNRFTVITNPQSSEFIITFYQTMPELDEKGNVTATESVEIGKYIMSIPLAEQFSKTISNIIDQNNNGSTDER